MAECGNVEQCGSSVTDLISWLGCHLKDPDQVRWSGDYLHTAIGLATRQIASDRKDLFRVRRKIPLQPGCYTDVCTYCPECEDIGPPYSNEKDCESEISDSPRGSNWADKYFNDFECDTSDETGYKVESVVTDPANPCLIQVHPTVPDDGNKYYIYAQCSDVDALCASPILPRGVRQNMLAFINLVFFFTYSMDSMVNLDPAQAQQYLQNYVDLLGISRQYDQDKLDDVMFGERDDSSQKVGAS